MNPRFASGLLAGARGGAQHGRPRTPAAASGLAPQLASLPLPGAVFLHGSHQLAVALAAVEMTHQFRHRRTRPTWDGRPTFPIRLCILLDDGASKTVNPIITRINSASFVDIDAASVQF